MNLLRILFLIVCSLHMFNLSGQYKKSTDFSHALHVGDRFEGPAKMKVMRGHLKDINWEKYRNKVLVLEFFGTGCTTCILGMPKLQAIQDKHVDKVQIINVAYQDRSTLEKFFAANDFLKEHKVNLPVIYEDTKLKSLFPYVSEPHVVIIYKGEVRAITFGRLVTEENLLAIYNDKKIEIPLKNDFGVGQLNMGPAMGGKTNLMSGVWLSSYQQGVASRPLSFGRDSISGKVKSSFYNRSILNALNMVWSKIKAPTYMPRAERMVWKVKDSTAYDNFDAIKELWDVDHAISYERLDLIDRHDSIQARIVLDDLHSFLGIKSYYTTKSIDCLILSNIGTVTEKSGKIADENSAIYENSSGIVFAIDFSSKFPPVKDFANRRGQFELSPFTSMEDLNKQLLKYGMKVSLGKSEMEVFVIEGEAEDQ